MKLQDNEFKKQLEQYIQFRGIDIILHLKDGTVIELDKNRKIDGDIVIRHTREGKKEGIHLEDIVKADFYAA
ncbi:MAG: hypothetical protein JNM27_08810 [Leptospirales bacterium]|nr:hypothetical protein [Leptospirales bacterium]